MVVLNDDEPVFSPPDFISYIAKLRNIPLASLKVPERMVITYRRRDYDQAKEFVNGERVRVAKQG